MTEDSSVDGKIKAALMTARAAAASVSAAADKLDPPLSEFQFEHSVTHPDPFEWHDVSPLGRNVIPGDIATFGQVITITADPSRNTVSCGHLVDGLFTFTNIAGDRRLEVSRPIPVRP